MSVSTRLITYEESLTMPESNLEEIVDGELFTMPPGTKNHNAVIRALQKCFDRQLPPEFDLVYLTGFLLKRSPLRYRIPDLAVVRVDEWRNDLRNTSDPYSRIVPRLVIEVISPANRKGDRARLVQNYAEFGVPEVLLFYPGTRVLEFYQGTVLEKSIDTGIVSPVTMPEISIDLEEIWAAF
jgi:Uma2 family endonuclease